MSPPRSLLAHVDSSPRSRLRIAVAERLATQFGAAATAAYAVTPVLVAHPVAFMPGGDATAMLVEYDEQRLATAKAYFDEAADAGDSHLKWVELPDEPVRAFVQAALYADLLVLGQREPKEGVRDVPPDFVASVIAGSGTPALVLPYIQKQPEFGRRIMVAWKETRESAHAVASAMPMLQAADQVDVALWDEGYGDLDAVAGRIEARLRGCGLSPVLHRCGPEASGMGELILSRAADLGADLLVMGCYGHSRAREWMLGGASHTLLESMTLPVWMAH